MKKDRKYVGLDLVLSISPLNKCFMDLLKLVANNTKFYLFGLV